jgi:hypothetical protein
MRSPRSEQLLHSRLMKMTNRRLRDWRGISFADIPVVGLGCLLLVAAAAANRAWFDQHFLPSFWTSHEEIVSTGMRVRAAVAVAGVIMMMAGRKIGRALARDPLYAFTIPLAIAMAFGATELVLRGRSVAWSAPTEPRTHPDALAGWLMHVARMPSPPPSLTGCAGRLERSPPPSCREKTPDVRVARRRLWPGNHLLGPRTLARTKVDAERAERRGALVLRSAAKNVRSPRNLDLLETTVRQERDQLCFQQSTGDSAGP